MYDYVEVETHDSLATVTLNRPDKLNAYVPRMGMEIVKAFERIRADENARAVILTGAGRGFCAGVDLDYLKASAAGRAPQGDPVLGQEPFVRTWPLEMLDYPKPVIAAINGAAVGVGITMTLPCDIRIASSSAKLAINFAKLGILPGLGSTHLLPRIIGIGNALDLVLSGRKFTADEALQVGLIQQVTDDQSLLRIAKEKAKQMAECRPEVLAAAKRALRYGAEVDMQTAMKNEHRATKKLRER